MRSIRILLLVLLCNGCSYSRVVIDCRVQTQITPVIPVVVVAKVDLSRPESPRDQEVAQFSRRRFDGAFDVRSCGASAGHHR